MNERDEVGEIDEVDLLVLGSGAAGLTAAALAADSGARVLVVESTSLLGGTTARSAGTCWVPGNTLLADPAGDALAASRYLDALVADDAPLALREQFVADAPRMLQRMRAMGLSFRPTPAVDYHEELPGAGSGGRALEPAPFDGRRLGAEDLALIRPPIPAFGAFGGSVMVRRAEAKLLQTRPWSWPSAVLRLRLAARWARDVRFGQRPRSTRLTMGNALIAALLEAARRRGVAIAPDTTVVSLSGNADGVTGAVIRRRGTERRVRARAGVVLAGGGFAAGTTMRAQYLPAHGPLVVAAPGARGETVDLALAVGAGMSHAPGTASAWFPCSVDTGADGQQNVFPHIWDRGNPGVVLVDDAGHRFTDETRSYQHVCDAMHHRGLERAWLVADAPTLDRYGLGLVRPRASTASRRRLIDSGYLKQAASLATLAAKIGADAENLRRTVARTNATAAGEHDDEFGRGATEYSRRGGDEHAAGHPSIGPVRRPPFFAIAVVAVPFSTASGLDVDRRGRVLSQTRQPIPGLYAAGSDAASPFASHYPGAGAQIGRAMTTAFTVVCSALPDPGNGPVRHSGLACGAARRGSRR